VTRHDRDLLGHLAPLRGDGLRLLGQRPDALDQGADPRLDAAHGARRARHQHRHRHHRGGDYRERHRHDYQNPERGVVRAQL
jgi:hypothetical protein